MAGSAARPFGRPFGEKLPWDVSDEDLDRLDELEPDVLVADLWATADESREEIVELYRRVWVHSDETIDSLPLDAVGHVKWWPAGRNEVTLHRILVQGRCWRSGGRCGRCGRVARPSVVPAMGSWRPRRDIDGPADGASDSAWDRYAVYARFGVRGSGRSGRSGRSGADGAGCSARSAVARRTACRSRAQRNATMAHRCCYRRAADRNDVPAMLWVQHRCPSVVVCLARLTTTVGHRCGQACGRAPRLGKGRRLPGKDWPRSARKYARRT